MLPTRVCIATFELKGFTPGGIGVLVHNILKTHACDSGSKLSVLWYGVKPISDGLFRRVFQSCEIFDAAEWAARDRQDGVVFPSRGSFVLDRHWQSAQLMRALRAIEKQEGPFDVIEFPDFGGAAFAALQEKKLGRAFDQSLIAVRLHSTEAILRRYDHRPQDQGNAVVADLERKALSDADLIIGHLNPVVDDAREFFGLPGNRLRMIVEHPPVLVDFTRAISRQEFGPHTSLVFTSKIQWFKQPHLFVNGVVGFMNAELDFKGEALLLAHVIDEELRHHCEKLVPRHLKGRIRILENVVNSVREEVVAGSVAIFPSAYESFCLAAYEASRLGALVVLNENTGAFGADTPWKRGTNCEKFDGTGRGLVSTLRNMWDRRRSLAHEPVSISPPSEPYWLTARTEFPTLRTRRSEKRRVASLVITVSEEFGDPMETIRSVLLCENLELDIILSCDFAPAAPDRAAALARIRGSSLAAEGKIRIVELGFQGGLAALCNLGLREARSEIVGFARGGASIHPRFLIEAIDALEAEPEYDLVIPQLLYVENSETFHEDTVRIGEALNAGTSQNLFGSIEMVTRRCVAGAVGFDEAFDRYVDWDFYMRACAVGHRCIVSNRIDVRMEVPNLGHRDFRTHLDALLVKHRAIFAGGIISLACAFDAKAGNDHVFQPGLPAHNGSSLPLFAKRPLQYYLLETRPWWRVAYKHPLKPLRWLLVREIQRIRAKRQEPR